MQLIGSFGLAGGSLFANPCGLALDDGATDGITTTTLPSTVEELRIES